jgi:hypothetical protein
MTAITTTEHHLSKADLKLAEEIAFAMEDVEGQMMNICAKVYKACQAREEKSADAFLAIALPNLSRANRIKVRHAGSEVMRRRSKLGELEYGWSTLAEIHSLPESHKDWAYEEKRTRQEIRDYKKQLKGTNDSVTPDEAKEKVKDYQEYATELLGVISLLQSELHDLKQQQTNDTSQVFTPLPEHDSSISASPHPQKNGTARLEMGDEAVDDFNRVHRLLDEIDAIEGKYFCKGIWGKEEWASLYGAHVASSASSNAQRNYKHRPKQGSVIEVRGTVVEDEA